MSQEQQAWVTFRDVAACFSEEEWKLLHEWQKELYRNVMNEIHQALLSMGYQIVNTDVLLRINKKEETWPWDTPEAAKIVPIKATSACYPSVHPDVIFRIKQEERLQPKEKYGAKESDVCARKGDTIAHNEILFGMKKEDNLFLQGLQDTEERESDCLNSELLFDRFLRTEDEANASLLAKQDEEGQITTSPSSGFPVDTLVVPFTIKEEDEAFCVDPQDFEQAEGIEDSKADEGMTTREKKTEVSKIFVDKAAPLKSSSGRAKVKVPWSFEEATSPKGEPCLQIIQKKAQGTASPSGSGYTNTPHSSSGQGTLNLAKSNEYHESANNLENIKLPACKINAQQNWQSFSRSPFEKSVRQNIGANQNHKAQLGNMLLKPNSSEKIFSLKEGFRKRRLIENRSFQCLQCEKSFKVKDHFIRHERIHTGERPFQCTVCSKSFSQKGHLIGHQRIHTGERPYQCAQCRKRFNQKGSLMRHQRTHTGEKPYECTQCDRCFGFKEGLIKHQRTHINVERQSTEVQNVINYSAF